MSNQAQTKLKRASEIEWTEEIESLLGKVKDIEITKRFGIAPRSIVARRRRLGIQAFSTKPKSPEPKWTKKIDKLLGTRPDTGIAAQVGTTAFHIRKRRHALRVSAYKVGALPEITSPKKERLTLTAAQEAKLGTIPDTILADRWGCTPGTVTRYRQRRGIPAFRPIKETEWTIHMLDLLGELPDSVIAREYEISNASVKIKRIEMGVLPYGKQTMDPEPDLPKAVIRQIGTVPDKQLSDRYGVQRLHIRVYRALHQIPAADYTPPTLHDWSAKDEEILGTMSDGDVARKLQVPRTQVSHRRKQLGIAPFDRKKTVRWTKAKLELLGKEPDQLLARQWGYSSQVVALKRESLGIPHSAHVARIWTDEELALLGVITDPQLAKKIGISPRSVAHKRQELGIPATQTAGPYNWKKRDLARLGKMPDDELAIELGLSDSFVAQKRRQLGIHPFRSSDQRWTDQIFKKMGVISDAESDAELGCSTVLDCKQRNQLNIPPITKCTD